MRFVTVGVAALVLELLGGCAHPPASHGRESARDSARVTHAPTTATTPQPAQEPDSAQVVAMLAGMKNAACPLPGVATGGQPDSAQLAALARRGFRTVLDLRTADEPRGMDEAAVARSAGLDYVVLPVTAETLSDSTFDAFRALAGDPARHPILVHCASGNRVGAAMIPWLVLDLGWSVERAVAAANTNGLRSHELRARAIDYVERRRPAGE